MHCPASAITSFCTLLQRLCWLDLDAEKYLPWMDSAARVMQQRRSASCRPLYGLGEVLFMNGTIRLQVVVLRHLLMCFSMCLACVVVIVWRWVLHDLPVELHCRRTAPC